MGKPIVNIMLDLETLDTTSDSAVIQIGLAYMRDGAMVVREVDISPTQYYKNPAFSKSQQTVDFHKRTNPDNFTKCCASEFTIPQAAQMLVDWIEEAKGFGKYQARVWCCGTDFDIPIIKNMLNYSNIKGLGIQYTAARDYRTMRELFKARVPKIGSTVHSAGQDAEDQLRHLTEILQYLASLGVIDNADGS